MIARPTRTRCGLGAVLTAGAVAGSVVALSVPAQAKTPPPGPPCGFHAGQAVSAVGDPIPSVPWTVRNCRTTTVKRAVQFSGKRTRCLTYRPNQVHTGNSNRGFIRLVPCK
jgi:hypothetical protein